MEFICSFDKFGMWNEAQQRKHIENEHKQYQDYSLKVSKNMAISLKSPFTMERRLLDMWLQLILVSKRGSRCWGQNDPVELDHYYARWCSNSDIYYIFGFLWSTNKDLTTILLSLNYISISSNISARRG